MPAISIVIPVYNGAAYIEEAVRSALGQSFPDREVIVVNDGSTDTTLARIGKFRGRIRLINKANGGTASALNLGICHARGEYVAWLSADDVFLPQKLYRQMQTLVSAPDAALCYTDWFVIDKYGRITAQSGSPTFATREAAVEALFQGCCINGSTVLVKRAALEQVGLFNVSYRQAHDYDMWLRLSRYHRFVHAPEPLLKYRWHDTNLSQQADALAYNAEILAQARILHGRV